jgi:hypothetical protein
VTLGNVLATSWQRLGNVLATSWQRLGIGCITTSHERTPIRHYGAEFESCHHPPVGVTGEQEGSFVGIFSRGRFFIGIFLRGIFLRGRFFVGIFFERKVLF